MFDTIKKNKRESFFIVSIFIIVITLIIYYICMALDMGPISIAIALVFSVVSAWFSYYYSDQIVLKLNNARPATREENLQLVNILDSLIVASGLNVTPKLYVVDDPQPNAFATGRNPEHSAICVTTGLLEKLDYYELEGVIGHELGHIKNYDIRLSAVVTVMVGFVVMLSDMFSRYIFYGGSRRRNNNESNGNAIFMLIGLVFLILSPIFGKLQFPEKESIWQMQLLYNLHVTQMDLSPLCKKYLLTQMSLKQQITLRHICILQTLLEKRNLQAFGLHILVLKTELVL